MLKQRPNLKKPDVSKAAFVAESADLIGDVVLHKDSSVWFNVVLRADIARIEVGEGSNIQDGCVCHGDYDKPVIIGKGVTVGHNATLHACKIGDGSLIGMGAIVLDGAEVGEYSLVGAGAVVTPGTKIPPQSMVLGSPATIKKVLSDEGVAAIKKSGEIYVELAREYENSK